MTAPAKMSRVRVGIVQLPHAVGLPLPAYQTPGSAGLDLLAALPPDAPLSIPPGARALVPTGLVLELPAGHEAQIRPRSGLALRHGVTVLNSPGTIDADYRGEVQVILINLGPDTFAVRRGDRIAQMIVGPFAQAGLVTVDAVGGTERGAGGFGSTGTDDVGRASAPAHRDKSRVKKKPVPRKARTEKAASGGSARSRSRAARKS